MVRPGLTPRPGLLPLFGLSHGPVYKRRMAKSSRPDYPLPVLITATDALDAFCQRMHGETFITVDTEFMREQIGRASCRERV